MLGAACEAPREKEKVPTAMRVMELQEDMWVYSPGQGSGQNRNSDLSPKAFSWDGVCLGYGAFTDRHGDTEVM